MHILKGLLVQYKNSNALLSDDIADFKKSEHSKLFPPLNNYLVEEPSFSYKNRGRSEERKAKDTPVNISAYTKKVRDSQLGNLISKMQRDRSLKRERRVPGADTSRELSGYGEGLTELGDQTYIQEAVTITLRGV